MIPSTHSARALTLAFGFAVACSPVVAADVSDLEARLHRIESTLAQLESRLGETVSADELAPTLKEFSALTQALKWDGKSALVLARPAGKETSLSIGGYLHAQGEFGDAPDARYNGIANRFLLRRARFVVKGAFKEDFEFTFQSDFGANTLGTSSGYRAQIADTFITWTKYPAANLQLGQFKTPFGYEQLLPDTKTITAERSLPNDSLTVGRQIGFAVVGSAFGKRLTYSAGLFNGSGVNTSINDNDQFMYVGRVAYAPWATTAGRWSVGANGYATRDTGTFTGHRTGWGVDSQLNLGRFDLAAEYLHVLSNRLSGTDTAAEGYSLMGSYFLVPKIWQAVIRLENYDSNVATGNTTSESWLLGLNYLIKGDDLKLTFNYVLGNPAGPLSDQGRFIGRAQVVF